MKKVLIVENGSRISSALVCCIKHSNIFHVIVLHHNKCDLKQHIFETRPDILVMDMKYYSQNNKVVEAIAGECYSDCKLSFVNDYPGPGKIKEALETTPAPANELLVMGYEQMMHYMLSTTLDTVSEWITLMKSVAETLEINIAREANFTLTKTEKKVLVLISNDHSYKMVASALNISLETTKTHIRNIYKKMCVSSTASAIAKAMKFQLI